MLYSNNKQDLCLLFLHIPKAGGTTLYRIIERQYKRNEIYSISRGKPYKYIEDLINFPKIQKKKYKAIEGHMRFGLHEFLPQPCTYITILRNPIERVISTYNYIFQIRGHYLYEPLKSQNFDLKKLVASRISYEFDNFQTRLLFGNHNNIELGECSREMLENAKKNLQKHFTVVGLTERFDETLLLMKRALGWNRIYYIRQNVTKKTQPRENISKETIDTIVK